MGRKTSTTKKKKGPKGKRARAKAKVERRWGETAELEPAPLRRGKSRLAPTTTPTDNDDDAPPSGEPWVEPVVESSDDEEKEEMAVEKDLEPNEAYTALLSSIQKAGPSSNRESDNDGTDDDDASIGSEESHEPDSNGNIDIPDTDLLFHQRFSRPPLSDEELKSLAQPPSWQKNVQGSGTRRSWEIQYTTTHENLGCYLQSSHKQRAQRILNDDDAAVSFHTSLGAAAFNAMSLYADVSLTTDDRRHRADSMEKSVVCHVRRHLRQTRSWIARTNNNANDDAQRDQGFTRPSVLLLLPTRSCAYALVQALVAGAKRPTEQWERFTEEYGAAPPPAEEEDAHRQRVLQHKSEDWKELFDDDKNADDDFKVGIQWNMKKDQFRMFQDFLRSDIIVASPLGLKQLDSFDFLSSIEICFLGRADVLLQQNWDHVDDCLALLNQQPKDTNDTDFSRVRQYYLSGQASHWRQIIVESRIMDPSIQSTFRKTSQSLAGQVKIRRRYLEPIAILSSVTQTCVRVPCKSFADQGKNRVNYFMDKVFPTLQDQTLVYIQSYFDFVALRNCFIREDFSNYVSVTEYARHTEVARGRARFLQGRRKLLLYTGRAHFFLRHAIKGAHHVVFLGVPAYPSFYTDHVHRLPDVDDAADNTASCTLLFTPFEGHALERIMGSPNANRMMKSKTATFCLRAA